MNRRIGPQPLTVLLIVLAALPATAGEYFETNGVAIGGYDPVSYFLERKPEKGSPAFQIEHRGSRFYFTSADHRDAFSADPERFAPQYGGYCAFGMAKGYKAVIDPFAFTVVDDKLYLNYNRTVRTLWTLNLQGNIMKADHNWPEVRTSSTVTQ